MPGFRSRASNHPVAIIPLGIREQFILSVTTVGKSGHKFLITCSSERWGEWRTPSAPGWPGDGTDQKGWGTEPVSAPGSASKGTGRLLNCHVRRTLSSGGTTGQEQRPGCPSTSV